MALSRRMVAVASVVVIAGVMLAQAGAPATAATTNLQLRERSCSQRGSFCHTEGQGFQFGDEFTFNLLLVSRPDEVRAGREHGQCVVLNRTAKAFYCDFIVELADGSIAVQGSFSFADDTIIVPIVGGTGAYESAGGYWSQTGNRVDLHIVTP